MPIKETDLTDAIARWGNELVAISTTYEEEGIEQATSIASEMLDRIYGFEFGPILFKPTLSGGDQTFRTTKQGALSYFVGHDPHYPADTGFGIKFWREVELETSAIMIEDTVAMWMGWVMFTDKEKSGVIALGCATFGLQMRITSTANTEKKKWEVRNEIFSVLLGYKI